MRVARTHALKEQALKEKIEAVLSRLVGLPLWQWAFAANMVMFDLGARIPKIDFMGREGHHGEYDLHLQCPWRITGPEGLIVGLHDIFFPEDWDSDWATFDREKEPCLCMGRLRELFDTHEENPLVVEAVEADRFGGFNLALSHGYALEAFPASSRRHWTNEHWRLLLPEDEHFVVTTCGIE